MLQLCKNHKESWSIDSKESKTELMGSGLGTANTLVAINLLTNYKRYFIIDQQIARHFVQYSEYLSNPDLNYAPQIINLLIFSIISTNHDKG